MPATTKKYPLFDTLNISDFFKTYAPEVKAVRQKTSGIRPFTASDRAHIESGVKKLCDFLKNCKIN